MKVNPRHVVLYAVDAQGGQASGKTFLQKLCFFVGRLTDQPLDFRAHYYGPYSEQVSAEIAFLCNGGFLAESRRGSGVPDGSGWEIARYDYLMTEKGKAAVLWIEKAYPEDAKRIREAARRVLDAGRDLDYVGLSLAAKTFWILSTKGGPLTFNSVAESANQFAWKVNADEVRKASEFLQKLNLVGVSQAH